MCNSAYVNIDGNVSEKQRQRFFWLWWVQHLDKDAAIDAQFGQNGIWTKDAESWRFSKCFLYQKTLTTKLMVGIFHNDQLGGGFKYRNFEPLPTDLKTFQMFCDKLWRCNMAIPVTVAEANPFPCSIVGSQTLSNLKRPIYMKRCFSGGNGPRICQHFRWIHAS